MPFLRHLQYQPRSTYALPTACPVLTSRIFLPPVLTANEQQWLHPNFTGTPALNGEIKGKIRFSGTNCTEILVFGI